MTDDLRTLAEAARLTPGDWREFTDLDAANAAAFIAAASPDRIIALLDERDRLRAALVRLVTAWDNGVSPDPNAWPALDREINRALEQARAALGDDR